MVCIYCNSKTAVINSRSSSKTNTTWRRRSCKQCRAIFTTRESPDLESSLRVSTASGHLKPFLRDKLFLSVFLSLSHRKTALTDATSLTDTILNTMLTRNGSGMVQSTELIEITSIIIKHFDQAAYTYYATHHKI